jgi:predicted adenylyl cyclase CyaB
MATNLELKIKLNSFVEINKRLKSAKAKFAGVLKQKDIYYNVKDGLLKLRIENGCYTLIKYLRDEKGKRWSNYELLFLSGKNPPKYLSEIFDTIKIVEKKRELYLYKNTRIHLDEVKKLGKFLELETVVTGYRKSAKKEFNEVVNLLKIKPGNQIRASYSNLIG